MNKEIMKNIEVLDSLPIVNRALKILHFRIGRIIKKLQYDDYEIIDMSVNSKYLLIR